MKEMSRKSRSMAGKHSVQESMCHFISRCLISSPYAGWGESHLEVYAALIFYMLVFLFCIYGSFLSSQLWKLLKFSTAIIKWKFKSTYAGPKIPIAYQGFLEEIVRTIRRLAIFKGWRECVLFLTMELICYSEERCAGTYWKPTLQQTWKVWCSKCLNISTGTRYMSRKRSGW